MMTGRMSRGWVGRRWTDLRRGRRQMRGRRGYSRWCWTRDEWRFLASQCAYLQFIGKAVHVQSAELSLPCPPILLIPSSPLSSASLSSSSPLSSTPPASTSQNSTMSAPVQSQSPPGKRTGSVRYGCSACFSTCSFISAPSLQTHSSPQTVPAARQYPRPRVHARRYVVPVLCPLFSLSSLLRIRCTPWFIFSHLQFSLCPFPCRHTCHQHRHICTYLFYLRV